MVATPAPLSVPTRDETARLAIRRAEGGRDAPLTASIAEHVAAGYRSAWLDTALGRAVVAMAARTQRADA